MFSIFETTYITGLIYYLSSIKVTNSFQIYELQDFDTVNYFWTYTWLFM